VEVLTKGGFKVIREKIEAVAGITQGVPETKDDVRAQPHTAAQSLAHGADILAGRGRVA
jgi:hypothetical protein